MTSKELQEALNAHLNKELYSWYLYLSMAGYFEHLNFPGFSAWMSGQAEEERMHAMKFWTHIYDRGGRVTLLPIDDPPADFKSPVDAFSQALDHEKEVTEAIHKLYARAIDEKDYASEVFLQWFVNEQVEEEKMLDQIAATMKRIDEDSASLLMLDRELGQRGGASGVGSASG